MPGSDFPIRGQELRNWLNTAGQGIILQFDTASAALDYLRSQGGAIRTSDFNEIYSNVWNRYTQDFELGFIPGDNLIPKGLTITNTGWDLSTNFLYRFKVIGTDPETGAPTERFLAVGSDRQLTPNEAASMLDDMIAGEEGTYGITDVSYSLDGAFARPEAI